MRWLSSVIPIWLRKKAAIGGEVLLGPRVNIRWGWQPPDVATLSPLTVQRPESREDTIHVQYEQEAILVTDQAADERGGFPETELRRRLHLLGENSRTSETRSTTRPVIWLSLVSTMSTEGSAGLASLGEPNGIRRS